MGYITKRKTEQQVKNIVINSLVETNNCVYNLYLEDWKS